MTSSGELKIVGIDGSDFGSLQVSSSNNFDWSENGDYLRITVNGQYEKRILELKASDFSIISNTSTFSNLRDYVIVEDEIGKISQIFRQPIPKILDIGVYQRQTCIMDYLVRILMEMEFDTFDDDDDGDGIIDQWILVSSPR